MRWASLLGVLAIIASAPAAADDDADLVPMWILPGAVQHSVNSDCSGDPRTGERAGLPAGLRVMAKPLEPCGQWIRIHVPTGDRGVERLITAASMITAKPPRTHPWGGREAIKEGWIRGSGIWGRPLDQPGWDGPVPLREGEHVEVLDENDHWVVRTVSGRVLMVRYGAVEYDRDPALQGSSGAERKAARERWEAGRKRREGAVPISAIVASEVLVAEARQRKGQLFTLEFGASDLSDSQFEDGWLDPVQQVLRVECDPRRGVDPGDPCGTYVLDYRALGAWWPTGSHRIAVESMGTAKVDGAAVPRLRVLVVEPWKVSGGVGPEWAEGGK